IQLPDVLTKALKEAGPAAGNAGMFSEEGFKNMVRDSSLVLPAQALDKPWTRQRKIPAPPLGTQVVDMTYKYDGTEGDDVKIGMALKMSLEPDPNAPLKARIGPQEGKGSFVFDSKAGRVVRSSVSQKGEMIIEVKAPTGNTEVVQTSDTTTDIKLVKAEGGSPK